MEAAEIVMVVECGHSDVIYCYIDISKKCRMAGDSGIIYNVLYLT